MHTEIDTSPIYVHFSIFAAHECIGCGAISRSAKLNSEVVGLVKSSY